MRSPPPSSKEGGNTNPEAVVGCVGGGQRGDLVMI